MALESDVVSITGPKVVEPWISHRLDVGFIGAFRVMILAFDISYPVFYEGVMPWWSTVSDVVQMLLTSTRQQTSNPNQEIGVWTKTSK